MSLKKYQGKVFVLLERNIFRQVAASQQAHIWSQSRCCPPQSQKFAFNWFEPLGLIEPHLSFTRATLQAPTPAKLWTIPVCCSRLAMIFVFALEKLCLKKLFDYECPTFGQVGRQSCMWVWLVDPDWWLNFEKQSRDCWCWPDGWYHSCCWPDMHWIALAVYQNWTCTNHLAVKNSLKKRHLWKCHRKKILQVSGLFLPHFHSSFDSWRSQSNGDAWRRHRVLTSIFTIPF